MASSPVNVRFAPSPTGYLHVGNVRTALINWLFARQHGGTFLLRLDDTDAARSSDAYAQAIREDLDWLGLTRTHEARQSERLGRYQEMQRLLYESGRLYACYETPQELDIKRKMQISRGQPPIYDRSALRLSDAQKRAYEAEGRTPHFRFKLEDRTVAWSDLIRGEVSFSGPFASDPVLIRADGVALFTFASCVDDGDMGITHILRGEDHVSNSAVQVQIFEALGYPVPRLGHVALLTMKDAKLSKRENAASVREMREAGILPLPLLCYLARIGTSDPIELADSMQELIARFDCSKFSRAAAIFDRHELERLNAKHLHQAPFDAIRPWLATHDLPVTARFWEQIRPNITALPELADWWALIEAPVTPVIEDDAYCRTAASLLPENEDITAEQWHHFIAALKERTGRKGKPLFMPLRLALTARRDGPELPTVWTLLGRHKVYQRLMGETA